MLEYIPIVVGVVLVLCVISVLRGTGDRYGGGRDFGSRSRGGDGGSGPAD